MDVSFLGCVQDREATLCALAERAFVRELGGGCSSPVAAYAAVSGASITITGLYVDDAERTSRGTVQGPAEQGEHLARELAKKLKEDALCRAK
jgi:hydroxymethylbilane synthase